MNSIAEKPENPAPGALLFERAGEDGKSQRFSVDGDAEITLPAHCVALAANNLEFAFQRGLFNQLSIEQQHAISGNIVRMKASLREAGLPAEKADSD